MRATFRQLFWTCLLLAVKVKARREVTEEEKHSPWINPSYQLCEQKQCLAIEDIFNTTVDLYQNPCEDYSKYACNRKYEGSRDHEAFSREDHRVANDLSQILEQEMSSPLDQSNHALTIEKSIFKLCKEGAAYNHQEKEYYVQTVMTNSRANRLLLEYDYQIDQWRRWEIVDLSYATKGFGSAFFEIDIYERNETDTNSYVSPGRYIRIKPPPYEIGLLQRLLSERFKKGSGQSQFHSSLKHVKLESLLTKLQDTFASGRVAEKNADIVFMTVSQWQNEYDTHSYHVNAKIDWLNYLSKLFGKVRAPVRPETKIAIQKKDYFFNLARNLMEDTTLDVIEDYVHLHFVSKSIGLVDLQFTDFSILPVIKELKCTPGILAGAAYKYADEYFSKESRQLLVSMITGVKDSIVRRVQRAIDVISRYPGGTGSAIGLMSIFVREYKDAVVFAGYPEWLMEGTTAYSIYGGDQTIHQRTPRFYDNQVHLIERLMYAKLKAWQDKNMPIIDITELHKGFKWNEIKIMTKKVGRGSDDVTKEIVIPFGYFNEKDYRFFSSQLFDPVNYGAAATEVAFQMYSDLIGRLDKTYAAPACIKDRVPSQIQNRDTFIYQAVTYLLSIEASYEAWPSKHSYPIQFIDFGAQTDNDVFFLSFAQSLCTIPAKPESSERSQSIKQNTLNYRHDDNSAVSNYINFVLQNFKPFAQHFTCNANTNQQQCDPLNFYPIS